MNITFTPKAAEELHKFMEEHNSEEDNQKPVLALYQYSARSWSGYFCQDVIQIVSKDKVLEYGDFVRWDDVDKINGSDLEVYIDKTLLYDLKNALSIEIDASFWNRFTKDRVSLLMKRRYSN